MDKTLKILHIDPKFDVIYCLIKKGAFIKSKVSLKTAVNLLKNEEFDLIISEPHHRAILDSRNTE
ncbi:MAG TPA: hypothetical protein VK564_13630 [Thermodesulfobacteriota bacterium]|nr:hypothetical protein [Thermodesulfobacteriota bacterium]